jgi:hypothetical protein
MKDAGRPAGSLGHDEKEEHAGKTKKNRRKNPAAVLGFRK